MCLFYLVVVGVFGFLSHSEGTFLLTECAPVVLCPVLTTSALLSIPVALILVRGGKKMTCSMLLKNLEEK